MADSVPSPRRLAKRIIACLDVRSNDAGDLVVTSSLYRLSPGLSVDVAQPGQE